MAVDTHVTQVHTRLPYQLCTKLSVRPLGFSSSKQCCVELFTAKMGLSLLCRMLNNLPVVFWASKVLSSVTFANLWQIHPFRARCFLEAAQSWNISWGISIHSPAFDLLLTQALALTQGRGKSKGRGLHPF